MKNRMKNRLLCCMLTVVIAIMLLPNFQLSAKAETTQRTTALNCGNFTQNESNAEEGWAWDYDTKTLTLTNVNFRNNTNSCITLPQVDSVIILEGDNTLTANAQYVAHGIYSEGNYTIKGSGTLTVEVLKSGTHAIFSKKSLNIEDCTIYAENVCDTYPAIWVYNNITVDRAILNINTAYVEAMGVAAGTIAISNSTVTTNSDWAGLYNYDGSITVTASEINTNTTSNVGWRADNGSISISDSEITIDAGSGIGLYTADNNINISNSTLDITAVQSTAIYGANITFTDGLHRIRGITYAVQATNELIINNLSVKGWGGSGYTVKGEVGSRSDNGRKVFIQSGFASYLNNVELKPAKTFAEINENISGTNDFSVDSPNLDDIVEHIIKPADIEGINTVTLSLNVSDNVNQSETTAIKTLADKGSEVYFFDVTLIKSINDGTNITNTTLTNIPVPVEVHIKLTGDLAGKSYYKVYRYHNGVAEQISNDPLKSEYYIVDIANSEIIIYTMKFSTYAIFGNDTTLQNLDENEGMDVQAKITDNSIGVYKVDISWGAMAFEWDTSGKTYDPDTHEWTVAAGGSWAVSSHNGVNNKITCANHSNGSLLASFNVVGTLSGVNYDVFTTNEDSGAAAANMPLEKVAYSGDITAPEIEAYLRLTGEPDSVSLSMLSGLEDDKWLRVGVVTVTLTPNPNDSERTPN